MNFRTTYFLFGAVAILLLAFLLILAFGPSGDADEFVLKSLHESIGKDAKKQAAAIKSITRLEVQRLSTGGDPEFTLVFTRDGETWKLEKPYEAKIDGKIIEDAVTRLVEARIDRKAEITHKLPALGLDNPSAIITVRTGDKDRETSRVILGNISAGGAVVFALTSDRGNKDPIAIRKTDLDGLFRDGTKDVVTAGEAIKSVTDFRPRELLVGGNPVAWDVVNQIHLKEGDKEIVLHKDDTNSWRFLKPENYGTADPEGDPAAVGPAAENIAGVKPLLTLLSGFRIGDAADTVENPAKLEDFGLEDGKESLRVEIGMKNGGTDVLRFGKTEGGKISVRLNGERFMVKVADAAVAPLRKLLNQPMVLRDRTLLQLLPVSIDAIDVKIGNEKKYELRLSGNPRVWRIFSEGSGDSFELANGIAVQAMINQLTNRRSIKDFPDSKLGDKAYGLDPPAVEMSLWQGGILPEKKEDKKDDETKKDEKPAPVTRPTLAGEPTVKLKFGKVDKDMVYVRRQVGTLSTLLALPDTLLAAVNRPSSDYLDLLIPSFERAKVTKLGLQREAEKYEFEKENGDPASPKWKIVLPADQAGRSGSPLKIDLALNALNAMQPTKIVAPHATDAELTRFGLKSPRISATVTVKDVKEPFTYAFGNETDDHKFYYCRFGGTDRVYHIGKNLVDSLFHGDFQDTTIFQIDIAKVKSIKLTGWKDVVGDVVWLEFVRKSEREWTVKDKADFVVDDRFAKFVAEFAGVNADRFVKGGPTPEMKLDVKDGAMAIEIVVDGTKDPITLVVGTLEKEGKDYFATSNRVPGQVFLLAKDRFEEMRKKPTSFKKP